MSTTSKKYFEGQFKNILWERFLKEIKKSKTGKELEVLLNKYLTPNERVIIEKRLAILFLLEKGSSYQEIKDEADVTSKTVSFVKRGFKKPTKRPRKENFQSEELKRINKPKRKFPNYPTYKGKGRWRFLNNY